MRATAVGIALVGVLTAQAVASSTSYDSCLKASGSVDPVMRDCQGRELARQDRALNAACAVTPANLAATPATAAKLKDAERAWIRFRAADCDVFDSGLQDGSLDRMALTDGVIDKMKARVAELNVLDTDPDVSENDI